MPTLTAVSGIFAPTVTPFDASGDALDLAGFASNIRGHIAAGLDGIVVAGSTGEAALLTETERGAMLEAARSAIPSDRLLIAGVGAESTLVTVERARTAGKLGADAVLVVAPHYYPQSGAHEALVGHYSRIADASPVPVLLYNIPQYMHYTLPATTVAVLAQHANIIGMKDSSGDLAVLGSYLRSQSPTFSVLTGNASTLQAAFAAGVRGGILAVAVFVPALVLALADAARAGRTAEAKALQAQLTPLGKEIVGAFGPAGVKAAVDAVGLRGGRVRSPLLPLEQEAYDGIVRLVQGAPTPEMATATG